MTQRLLIKPPSLAHRYSSLILDPLHLVQVVTAPARGLTLDRVFYSPQDESLIAQGAQQAARLPGWPDIVDVEVPVSHISNEPSGCLDLDASDGESQ